MPESTSERHNRLGREFVLKAGKETSSSSEFMVVMESALMAAMLILTRLYGVSPAASSSLLESALQVATERFAESEKERKG